MLHSCSMQTDTSDWHLVPVCWGCPKGPEHNFKVCTLLCHSDLCLVCRVVGLDGPSDLLSGETMIFSDSVGVSTQWLYCLPEALLHHPHPLWPVMHQHILVQRACFCLCLVHEPHQTGCCLPVHKQSNALLFCRCFCLTWTTYFKITDSGSVRYM